MTTTTAPGPPVRPRAWAQFIEPAAIRLDVRPGDNHLTYAILTEAEARTLAAQLTAAIDEAEHA
jgi:hypothetical protein